MECLLYGSKLVVNTVFLWECAMNSVMVESNIVCQSGGCAVERLRSRVSKQRPVDDTTYSIMHGC
jgi:hypothetical protein